MRKALIITYDFPPAWTSGVNRPLKFAKYLPEFGWQPVILTVKNFPGDCLDPTLLDDLPTDTPIRRAYSWELYRLEKAVYTMLFGRKLPGSSAGDFPPADEIRPPGRFISMARRYFLSPLSRLAECCLYIPDNKSGWIPQAVINGLSTIRKQKIDLIYSTSPPETNHIVALLLKKWTDLSWVAEMTDPWTENPYRSGLPRLRLRLERRLEHKVLARADNIIYIGDEMAKMSKTMFPDIKPDKHFVIHNGFDEADFVQTARGSNRLPWDRDCLNFINVGTIYEDSALGNFLKGFAKALESGKMGRDVRLNFIGNLIPMWRRELNKPPFREYVNLLGFKSHRETIRLMSAADVLLLMPMGGEIRFASLVVTGKVFELMRSGRPIFMIGWEGECSEIIGKSGLGKIAAHDNIDQISEYIVEYYERKKDGILTASPDWNFINRYERKTLTGKLAKLFDSTLTQ